MVKRRHRLQVANRCSPLRMRGEATFSIQDQFFSFPWLFPLSDWRPLPSAFWDTKAFQKRNNFSMMQLRVTDLNNSIFLCFALSLQLICSTSHCITSTTCLSSAVYLLHFFHQRIDKTWSDKDPRRAIPCACAFPLHFLLPSFFKG
jgi:hypothetical protein